MGHYRFYDHQSEEVKVMFMKWFDDVMENKLMIPYDPLTSVDFKEVFTKNKEFDNFLANELIETMSSSNKLDYDGPDIRASYCIGMIVIYYCYLSDNQLTKDSILPPGFPETLRLIASGLGPILNPFDCPQIIDWRERKSAICDTNNLFSKSGEDEIPATDDQKKAIDRALLICLKVKSTVYDLSSKF